MTLDLGSGHTLTFVGLYGHPEVERYGARVAHARSDGTPCVCYITFASLLADEHDAVRPKWQVHEWEPLTLSPSLLCNRCGDHGFIREGRWVPA